MIQYSWLGVVISVLIAIQASAVALWFAFRQRGVIDTFLGAIFLGLTIALMHYSGMEATRFFPGAAIDENPALLWSEKYLAFAITVTIYGVCSTCLVVFSVLIWKPHRPTTPRRDVYYGKVADAVIEQIRFLGRTIERQKVEKHSSVK
jgi:NO-binding membrane sensor protein with MHYT domain